MTRTKNRIIAASRSKDGPLAYLAIIVVVHLELFFKELSGKVGSDKKR